MRCMLIAAVMLLASPASALVVHCPDGRDFIADSPAESECAASCAEWRTAPESDGSRHARCVATPRERAAARSETATGVAGIVLLCLVLAAYLLPSIVASRRRHPNSTAIFALNVLLGWTALGWIIALVWSLTAVPEQRD